MEIKKELIFHDGDAFFRDVFDGINGAQQSLLLEIHYIDHHKLGRRFFLALIEALARRVSVSIIIDGFSCHSKKLHSWLRLLEAKGAHITYFNPKPWHSRSLKDLQKLNQRNHKKVIIIDRHIAYLGSYNIDTRQMSTEFGGQSWRDIGVKIEGPIVKTIINGFYDTWAYTIGLNQKVQYDYPRLSAPIRLNHSKRARKLYFKNLIQRIQLAQERIWITNPYFVPDLSMIRALENAVARGIDVKIIVPSKSDLRYFPLINSLHYRELVRKGVKVYEYLPHILHAKILIIDRWMMIGSSNLNSRTQKHDWEIDIVLQEQKSQHELLTRFEDDLFNSRQLSYQALIKKFGKFKASYPLFYSIKHFL